MKHQNQQHAQKPKHQQKIEQKLHPQKEKVPLAEVIATLKADILKEVRQVSSGVKVSIYELIEMDKELAQLEAEAAPQAEVTADEF